MEHFDLNLEDWTYDSFVNEELLCVFCWVMVGSYFLYKSGLAFSLYTAVSCPSFRIHVGPLSPCIRVGSKSLCMRVGLPSPPWTGGSWLSFCIHQGPLSPCIRQGPLLPCIRVRSLLWFRHETGTAMRPSLASFPGLERVQRERERSMLNELLFTLFLTQVGTVAVITAFIVGAMALFYAERNALDKCDAEKPLEDWGKSVVRIKNFGLPHPNVSHACVRVRSSTRRTRWKKCLAGAFLGQRSANAKCLIPRPKLKKRIGIGKWLAQTTRPSLDASYTTPRRVCRVPWWAWTRTLLELFVTPFRRFWKGWGASWIHQYCFHPLIEA